MQLRAPNTEQEFRLARKSLFEALEREPEERFDRLTRLARRLFGLPTAMLVMNDNAQQWVKSIDTDSDLHVAEVLAYCDCAHKSNKILQISHSPSEPVSERGPATSNCSGYAFFASVPVYYGAEHAVGLLCVADTCPRVLDGDEQSLLVELGRLIELEMLMTDQSQTDLLTGVPNRRGFESQAGRMIRYARKEVCSVVAIYFDIDDLGSMNRLLGHAAADQALRLFSNTLCRVIDGDAVLGRLGGDEFALLALGLDRTACEEIVDRVRAQIADPSIANSPACELRFSFGVAVDDAQAPKRTLDDLIQAANADMHQSSFILRERCFPLSAARRSRGRMMLVDTAPIPFVAHH